MKHKTIQVLCPYCEKKYTIEKSLMEIFMDSHMKCPGHDNHFFIEKERFMKTVPKDIKQKVLDLFRSSKTIGEIGDTLDIPVPGEEFTMLFRVGYSKTRVIGNIISENIEHVSYLRSEAKE